MGGMLGGAVGILTKLVTGSALTQPGSFVLVGMGAAFAGIVRAPVTSIIIIFEMTNNYSMILPLMVANIISYAMATRLSPTPIYDALLKQDGVRLPQAERHALKQIPISAAMTRDVTTVASDITVAAAFRRVQDLPEHHHAYPVIEDGNRLAGLFTFNDLKRALAEGLSESLVKEIASKSLVVVRCDQSLEVALLKLGRYGISQLPVISRDKPPQLLGIVTMHDIAETLSKNNGRNELSSLAEIEDNDESN